MASDEIWYSKVTIMVCSLACLPSQSKVAIEKFLHDGFLIIVIGFPKIWLLEVRDIFDYIAIFYILVLYVWLVL